MTTLRLMVGVILLAFAGLIIIANWVGGAQAWVHGRRTSMIPIIGGMAGFAGWALLPGTDWRFGLLAFAADPAYFGIAGILGLFMRRKDE